MECLLPIMFILNTDASVIATLHDYKPNAESKMAYKTCTERLGTCPKSISIFPSGHIHINCKRRKK